MDEMILVDAHMHTAGISMCSRVPAERLIEISKQDAIDGIVLTNHYRAGHVRGTFPEWRKRYVEEYRRTKAFGDKAGVRVFFGLEVTLNCMMQNDFLVYGLTEQDVLEADPLFDLTLPELSAFVHSKNALLYHAHPYRNTTPVEPEHLDGVEINCHPLYRTCEEKRVRAYADAHRLRISCGSDYHGDTYKAHCGLMIPSEIKDTAALTAYLRDTLRPPLVVAPDPLPEASVLPGMGGQCGI